MGDLQIYHYLILATISEAISEYFLSGVKILERFIKYLSAIIGVAIALVFQADIFTQFGFTTPYPLLSQILTGIIIARGSNVLNDLIETFYNFKKRVE